MSLLCDKYKPQKLDDLDFHKEQGKMLKQLSSNANFPHLFIYGPSGSGKKTRINALLFEMFGEASTRLKIELKIFESASGRKTIQRIVSSNYHLEVNPSENGFYDRVVVQELIKDVATSGSLSKSHPFKVVVIVDADRLTKEAQQALRRTLEKYVSTCRLILVGERSSRIIPALKSRCFMVRNPAPDRTSMIDVMKYACTKESVNVSDSVLEQIVDDYSDRNLRRALLLLQTYFINVEAGGSSKVKIIPFKWLSLIDGLAKKMSESQSVKKVAEIRSTLYELHTHLIPPEIILRLLTNKLLTYCLDDQMRSNLINISAIVDHRIAQGSKPVIHLELFAVKFMSMFRCTVEKVAFDLDQSMDID